MVVTLAVPVEQLWHRIPGGTARATVETMRAWRDDPEVVTRGLAGWHRPSRRARADGIGPVRYLPLHRRVLYEGWLRNRWPTVEQLVGPVDVVWAAATIPPPALTAPVVATVHDLGFLDNPERSSRRGQSFFPRMWAAVQERAALVVCPSQVVAADCARWGLEPERLRVVPWGVSVPEVSTEALEAVRSRLGLPERFALWVGTLEPRKNLPALVEAMAAIDDLPLAVVGPSGWNVDGDDLLAPIADRALRLGQVDDPTLHALYRAAAVFVFPSLVEGFGLPVLEAMAHGTPVVTGVATATAEVAGGGARLVDVTDPVAIAKAVLEAAAGGPDTSALVARGRSRAAELSWTATAAGYAEVCREAAEQQQ